MDFMNREDMDRYAIVVHTREEGRHWIDVQSRQLWLARVCIYALFSRASGSKKSASSTESLHSALQHSVIFLVLLGMM
jgi:hypothetical protein